MDVFVCVCVCVCVCAVSQCNCGCALPNPCGQNILQRLRLGSLKREVGIHCLVCLQYNNGCLMANA